MDTRKRRIEELLRQGRRIGPGPYEVIHWIKQVGELDLKDDDPNERELKKLLDEKETLLPGGFPGCENC
jgi:hypothetical protein